MKQKTIATRHLRTKIAAGYVLILFVIFGIVYIGLNEQNRQQELEATTYKIRSLRKDVHEVYMKVVDLSMIGETRADGYVATRLMCRLICNLPELSIRISRADGYVPTRLMYRLICNLPELSIRIFNPLTSYFLIYRCVFRIADPYIFCCRIANPTEH